MPVGGSVPHACFLEASRWNLVDLSMHMFSTQFWVHVNPIQSHEAACMVCLPTPHTQHSVQNQRLGGSRSSATVRTVE